MEDEVIGMENFVLSRRFGPLASPFTFAQCEAAMHLTSQTDNLAQIVKLEKTNDMQEFFSSRERVIGKGGVFFRGS